MSGLRVIKIESLVVGTYPKGDQYVGNIEYTDGIDSWLFKAGISYDPDDAIIKGLAVFADIQEGVEGTNEACFYPPRRVRKFIESGVKRTDAGGYEATLTCSLNGGEAITLVQTGDTPQLAAKAVWADYNRPYAETE
ncbi:MAG: hypothetical protein GY841_22110 [FCB group bacterium]|nr:hypothetical protein [FCB group bacterium]